jgi:hypothetical protein
MPLVVAALPALVLALVGMIILWGLALLLKSVLQAMANHVPIIGGPLSHAIGTIIDEAISLGYDAAAGVLHDALGLLLAPVYWIERHVASVINFFIALTTTIRYIVRTLIPDATAALGAQILAAYHNAIAYTQTVIHLVYAALAYDVNALTQSLAATARAIEAYALTLATEAQDYTTAAINAETAYVRATAGALGSEIQAVAGAESAYATALYHDAITYSQTLVHGAETTLTTEIGNVVAWAGQENTALAAAIAAMGTQVIAVTLDAVQTVEADLSDLKSECTDNLCSGLSDLADLLNALQGGLGLAALFALAAQFAGDPRGAAEEVRGALGTIANDAAGAVRTLIGI